MAYEVIDGIPVWGTPLDNAVNQMRTCQKTAARVAMMADHHLGYAVPIGGVVAYENAISPSGVGFDIGCGNKAVRLNMSGADLRKDIGKVMDGIWETVSFGMGRKNAERVDHPLFESETWKLPMLAPLKAMAEAQLGTVGSGNHYVDLFVDELDRVWVGVHFGSRGLGHKTATWFLKQAGAADGIEVEPCVLPLGTALADDYYAAMQLAGAYAYAGRDWVCSRVAALLGTQAEEEIHNHHNYAWMEEHDGKPLVVVRKGATPAFPGQLGFVGGTMTEQSVILRGRAESDEARAAMFSTVHGAGRTMGRMEAAGKYDRKTGECKREGKITAAMMDEDVARAGIELRGAGRDESSFCYKRLPEVLAAHSETVEVLHTLTPVGVAMAGKDVYDPFKD